MMNTDTYFKTYKKNLKKLLKKEGFSVLELKKKEKHYMTNENPGVYEFKISEIPEFLFGIWFSADSQYHSRVRVFAQHIDNIDKFKPDASFLGLEDSQLISSSAEPGISVINFIKYVYKHKELAWYVDNHYIDLRTEYVEASIAKQAYKKWVLNNKAFAKLKEKADREILTETVSMLNNLNISEFMISRYNGTDHIDECYTINLPQNVDMISVGEYAYKVKKHQPHTSDKVTTPKDLTEVVKTIEKLERKYDQKAKVYDHNYYSIVTPHIYFLERKKRYNKIKSQKSYEKYYIKEN